MFKKIRKYIEERKQYRISKRTLTLLLMNQYSDFLEAQKDAMKTEEEAYRSMTVFGDTFSPDDLKNLIAGVNKIANSPQLQTDYYKQVNENAHRENMKVAK